MSNMIFHDLAVGYQKVLNFSLLMILIFNKIFIQEVYEAILVLGFILSFFDSEPYIVIGDTTFYSVIYLLGTGFSFCYLFWYASKLKNIRYIM